MKTTRRPASAGTSETAGSVFPAAVLWQRVDLFLPTDGERLLLLTQAGNIYVGWRLGGRDGCWMGDDLPDAFQIAWWAHFPLTPNAAGQGAAKPYPAPACSEVR
jgi:hypothetical protein